MRPANTFDRALDFHRAVYRGAGGNGLHFCLLNSAGFRAHAAPRRPSGLLALSPGELRTL